ncbi:MAG: M48 family metallopeptidase [Promicromonosporaceae bacterium]|nr:M48 family metallopeptidase [Promicromonosporaceae bacterium]
MSTQPQVEVRRSKRRKTTVSAHQEGDRVIVAIPAHLSKVQEREWVAKMLAGLERKQAKRRPSDEGLWARAGELSRRYLGGRAQPTSVRWVTNQNGRWGSCTPAEGSIRLSTRLQGMPQYVLDYVLLHELAHLLCSGHGPQFWALLDPYPHTEKAKGFLDGIAHAQHLNQTHA